MTKEKRAELIRDRLRAKLGKGRWVAQPTNRPDPKLTRPLGKGRQNNFATILGDMTGRAKERVEWVWAPIPKPKVALVKNRTGDQHPISKIARQMYQWNRMPWDALRPSIRPDRS